MNSQADELIARAVGIMDRIDDALAAGNTAEANRLGAVRDTLFSWAADLECGRQISGIPQ